MLNIGDQTWGPHAFWIVLLGISLRSNFVDRLAPFMLSIRIALLGIDCATPRLSDHWALSFWVPMASSSADAAPPPGATLADACAAMHVDYETRREARKKKGKKSTCFTEPETEHLADIEGAGGNDDDDGAEAADERKRKATDQGAM